jgi:hypothetical protein
MIKMESNNPINTANNSSLKQQKTLMKWTIKAKPRDTIHMDIGMAIITIIGLIAIANGLYETYMLNLSEDNGSTFLNLRSGLIWTVIAIYLWKLVVHQKKIYSYTITDARGTEESIIDFPKFAGMIFKGISVIFFIFVVAAIIYKPTSILILAGPAGMALIAGRFFLSWNNSPKLETSADWNKYKFVTIDKKKRLIVAQETDTMIGFEARLPENLFDEYLATLKRLLPQDAVFSEEEWIW